MSDLKRLLKSYLQKNVDNFKNREFEIISHKYDVNHYVGKHYHIEASLDGVIKHVIVKENDFLKTILDNDKETESTKKIDIMDITKRFLG